jgi:transcriptional regulator with XRE-family HTH domain
MMNTQEAAYRNQAPTVPEWTLADRLAKARQTVGLSQKEFGKLTSLSTRQIQFAETGTAQRSQDVIITVYAFKTGVDYNWLKTGAKPTGPNGDSGESLLGLDSNQEPIGSSTLPGLDSNQEPFGSFLAYQIRRLERGRGLKYLERAA